MKLFSVKTDPAVDEKFADYPDQVRAQMLALRKLVIETARDLEDIEELEETLKWGEPSFKTTIGSTLRIDWKKKAPDQYAMYFQCSSRLVSTFRTVFSDEFQFEGNRAIIFQLHQTLPIIPLKECIKAALRYHKVKEQLTLGI